MTPWTKLSEDRRIAIVTGALFLTALLLNLLASALCDPILAAPRYLELAYGSRRVLAAGGALNAVCAVSMMFIPVVLFPLTSRFDRRLAVAYVLFRFTEGVLFLYLVIKTSTFIGLSEAYAHADGPEATCLRVLGQQLRVELHFATLVYVAVFVMGAATFYPLLHRSRLVPRFLSLSGLLGAGLLLVAVLLGAFDLGPFHHLPVMKAMAWFAPPIALNELTLATWLVVRGFDTAPPQRGVPAQSER